MYSKYSDGNSYIRIITMKQILKKIVIFILTLEARIVLLKYKPKIVAVTGSVGKTSTKDAIGAVLEAHYFTRTSKKSFNSEIGVPLTILGCPNGWSNVFAWSHIFFEGLALIFLKNHYPKILVVEVGTDRPGDIRRIARWMKPNIVVMTRIGEVPPHVEFFKSRDDLIREKTHLVRALRSAGTLILNTDDEDLAKLKESKRSQNSITFGMKEGAVLRASNVALSYKKSGEPKGVQCKVSYEGKVFPLTISGTIGTHYVYMGLAALAVGIAFEVNIVSLLEGLKKFKIPPGRGTLLKGIRDSIIIDDSYNASPVAVEASLASLASLENIKGRKIVVIGDMLELGKYSTEEHGRMGSFAAHAGDAVVTVGPRAFLMRDGAFDEGLQVENAYHFEDAYKAGEFLKTFIQEGDVVLVKGSQSMRMEHVVEAIMAEPEKKKELLVRQEDEWQNR